jgi:LacI family transcriptional regulator/LacI family repressor for deo operon, udp, cdd, tsx, nupC, and nupG
MTVTIKQVAARASVSTATVSYVLNGTGSVTDSTRRRVWDAIAELNYQPRHAARSMRGLSRTLGLVLPAQGGRLTDPALIEMLSGLADGAALRGYYLLIAPVAAGQDESELCLSLAQTRRVDGLALLDVLVDDARVTALEQAGVPHVCVGAPPLQSESPAVQIDSLAAARQAVQHLVHQGHHQIGLIQLPSELAESEPRYQGYVEALALAGLPLEDHLVVEAGRAEEDGYQAMNELLALPEPPTAVLACSDELAFGAMHALYDAGLQVGRDVSLIGFDDLPLAAHANPPLTAIHQPRRAIGEQLAELLDLLITGKTLPAKRIVLEARLIIRRSSGPAPMPYLQQPA